MEDDYSPGAGSRQSGSESVDSDWVLNTRTTSGSQLPKSVRLCRTGSHVLVLRNRETGVVSFEPFRCNSWRCPRCQRFKGKQDFVRVRDGMLSLGEHWVYLVLTLIHSHYANEWAAYNAGYFHWQKFSKRLIYHFGSLAYVQTWEKHLRSDFPHVNVAVHNEKIWSLCKGDGWKDFRQVIKPMLVETGFGYVVHVAPLRPGGSLSLTGYLTKLSRELTGAGIKNQVPVNAPPGFRRLRASRGLLAPIFRPGTHEGQLVPANTVGSADLSPEGWDRLRSGRLEATAKRQGYKQGLQELRKGVRHGRSKTA